MKQIIYEVGQLVRAKRLSINTQYNGKFCVISKPLATYELEVEGKTTVLKGYYEVYFLGGVRLYLLPAQLELGLPVRGDMDTKVLWEDCAWKPEHLRGNNDY